MRPGFCAIRRDRPAVRSTDVLLLEPKANGAPVRGPVGLLHLSCPPLQPSQAVHASVTDPLLTRSCGVALPIASRPPLVIGDVLQIECICVCWDWCAQGTAIVLHPWALGRCRCTCHTETGGQVLAIDQIRAIWLVAAQQAADNWAVKKNCSFSPGTQT